MKLSTEQKRTYSYIFLVALSALMAFSAVMVSLNAISDSNHKWCQIVDTITATPIPKPANPDANPSRERSWEFYIQFVELKRSLGC